MVSPEHVDEQKPEDKQVPSPAEEKQVLPVGEKKRPWTEPLMRIVAVVLSLIGGIAAVYLVVLSFSPWLELGYQNPSADRLAYLHDWAFLLVFLVGLGGAVLFRSWWALLVIPLALSLGAVPTYYLMRYQIATELLTYNDVGFGVFVYSIIIIPIIAVIGASMGSFIGIAWKERWKFGLHP